MRTQCSRSSRIWAKQWERRRNFRKVWKANLSQNKIRIFQTLWPPFKIKLCNFLTSIACQPSVTRTHRGMNYQMAQMSKVIFNSQLQQDTRLKIDRIWTVLHQIGKMKKMSLLGSKRKFRKISKSISWIETSSIT